MKKSLGRVLAGATALGLLVAPSAARAADSEDAPGLTRPVHMTEDDLDPGKLYSAPSFAIDPDNPLNVAASFSDLRSRRCGFMRSTDGGATWQRPDASPSLPGYPFCAVPSGSTVQTFVEFGRDGTLYYALTGWNTEDGGLRTGNVSVQLARSDDLGDSWQTTLVDDTRGLSGEETQGVRPLTDLVVDRDSGSEDVVYVGWTKTFTGTSEPDDLPSQAVVATSTDGGQTFSEPVSLAAQVFSDPAIRAEALASAEPPDPGDEPEPAPAGSLAAEPDNPANFGGSTPDLAVDDEGTLHAVWTTSTANIDPGPERAHFVSTSTDRGQTWSSGQIAPFQEGNASRVRMAWSPDGGDNGSLHIVSQANPLPDLDSYGEVFYRRSTDGGQTWSEEVPLTDDDPDLLRGQYQPWVSTAPNGRVDVTWWDTRDDPGIRGNDVYYTFSEDAGETWSPNLRITDRTVDRRVGVWAYNFDISSPPGIASSDAYTIFGWDDTRNSPPSLFNAGPSAPGFGTQDMYTASVQHAIVPVAESSLAKILLAGVIGLVAVGVLLLGITLGRRWGGGPPSSRRPVASRSTAKVG